MVKVLPTVTVLPQFSGASTSSDGVFQFVIRMHVSLTLIRPPVITRRPHATTVHEVGRLPTVVAIGRRRFSESLTFPSRRRPHVAPPLVVVSPKYRKTTFKQLEATCQVVNSMDVFRLWADNWVVGSGSAADPSEASSGCEAW